MAHQNQSQIKKRVGNYPYVNVIFSTTTALFIIGLFTIFAFLAQKLTDSLRKNIEIHVFLKKDLKKDDLDYIRKALIETPFLDSLGNKPRIRYVSKEQAAKMTIEETGDDFVEFLGENPLRDAFLVNIKEDFYKNNNLSEIEKQIESIPGVFELFYTKHLMDVIKDINTNIEKIGVTLSVFVLILLFTIVILINSAIRLALYSQRFLIRSMQLVGATGFFIKKPFLYRATLHGVVSGFLASGLLLLVLWSLMYLLQDFELELLLSENSVGTSLIFVGLIFLGGLIGFLSSYSSVSRYLKMKLDDLY